MIKYSKKYKDVLKIEKLAKGGEAAVYRIEHCKPDEIVAKVALIDEKTPGDIKYSKLSSIIYESQLINVNAHPVFVVYIDEEIIIYDEDSETILNYCVIVEEAKYSL